MSQRPSTAVDPARKVALEALIRIDSGGAYANIVLPSLLERSGLSRRDRAFATELVYGTTRMQRACDYLYEPFVLRALDPPVRAALRLGTYQMAFLATPPHAAVSATVSTLPGKTRGFVNAVLRRVGERTPSWPDDATRLSYPDWIVDRLIADLGSDDALSALAAMNAPATTSTREDGYIQDRASQLVVDVVDAGEGELVADLCAAPGGKATGLVATGALVVALDQRLSRVGLVVGNRDRLEIPSDALMAVAGDAGQPPLRTAAFDRVLLDAPCSGLGALRRRPDARWRITEAAIDRLAEVQAALIDAAATLVRPGGSLTYSVCTLTRAESNAVVDRFLATHSDFAPDALPSPWRSAPGEAVARLLPQDDDLEGTPVDGMCVARLIRSV